MGPIPEEAAQSSLEKEQPEAVLSRMPRSQLRQRTVDFRCWDIFSARAGKKSGVIGLESQWQWR